MESIEKSRLEKEEKNYQRYKQTSRLTMKAVGYLGEISNSIEILSMKKTQKVENSYFLCGLLFKLYYDSFFKVNISTKNNSKN